MTPPQWDERCARALYIIGAISSLELLDSKHDLNGGRTSCNIHWTSGQSSYQEHQLCPYSSTRSLWEKVATFWLTVQNNQPLDLWLGKWRTAHDQHHLSSSEDVRSSILHNTSSQALYEADLLCTYILCFHHLLMSKLQFCVRSWIDVV